VFFIVRGEFCLIQLDTHSFSRVSSPPALWRVKSSECALRTTNNLHLEQDVEELWHFSWTRDEQRGRERERHSYMEWVKLHINTLSRRCAGRRKLPELGRWNGFLDASTLRRLTMLPSTRWLSA
jgi:hypothetical protein